MKNICFYNSIHFWGGGEKAHFEHAVYFSKKAYNVYVFCIKDSELYKRCQDIGIKTIIISNSKLAFLNPLRIAQLSSVLKQYQIDTIIFSSSSDAKLAGLAGKIIGIKRIVYMRGLATEIKSSFINKFSFKNLFTHIVANSEETKQTILKNLSNVISKDDIKVIYRGFDFNLLAEKAKIKLDIPIPENKIVLGNVGRLTKQKGQHILLDISKKLKEANIDFVLIIAGTGELMEGLQSKIETYKLQNEVRLIGFLENVHSFMRAIDIFLFPSMWEGFGQVLTEAMYQSKPIVAFNMSSNPEVVVDGETGFLVPYPDIDAFYNKTQILIKDTALRKKMGETGKKRVVEYFKLTDKLEEFEQFLLTPA